MLGLVSYGVYLWHWPIFVLLDEARTGLTGWPLFGLRVAVTLAVSFASYRLVERPIRRAARRAGITLLRLVPAGAVVVVVAVLLATVPRSTTPHLTAADRAAVPAGAPVRVLVAGDSVALTLTEHEEANVAQLGIHLGSVARIGCGILPGDRLYGGQYHPAFPVCFHWADLYRAARQQVRPQVAVLAIGVWELFDLRVHGEILPFGTPRFEHRLRRALDRAATRAHGRRCDPRAHDHLVLRAEPQGVVGEHDPG